MTTIPEIDPATAATMRDEGATWIDVREDDEWQEARIHGTVHVPLAGAFDAVLDRWPALDERIVVSCLSGGRSGRLVERLVASGYTDVHNLRGGIRAWMGESRPVISG